MAHKNFKNEEIIFGSVCLLPEKVDEQCSSAARTVLVTTQQKVVKDAILRRRMCRNPVQFVRGCDFLLRWREFGVCIRSCPVSKQPRPEPCASWSESMWATETASGTWASPGLNLWCSALRLQVFHSFLSDLKWVCQVCFFTWISLLLSVSDTRHHSAVNR